jgi:sugar/nucleoside kinase (ribokinase family)
MDGAPKLAIVGDLVEDVIVWHRGPIEYATDNPSQVFRTRGGSAANVAVVAAGLCPVRFIGRVGDDPLADVLTTQLSDAGVEVRVQRHGRTGTIVILVDESGERTMFPDRGASAELADLDPAILDGVGWLHVPFYGFHTDASRDALVAFTSEATRRGIPLSVDLSSVAVLHDVGVDAVRDILGRVRPDIVFANAAEAAVMRLADHPIGLAVIKAGADPVTAVSERGPLVRVPVEPVDHVADATGAGDAFAAGYLAGALAGEPVERCIRAGAAQAALALQTAGAV